MSPLAPSIKHSATITHISLPLNLVLLFPPDPCPGVLFLTYRHRMLCATCKTLQFDFPNSFRLKLTPRLVEELNVGRLDMSTLRMKTGLFPSFSLKIAIIWQQKIFGTQHLVYSDSSVNNFRISLGILSAHKYRWLLSRHINILIQNCRSYL